MTSNLPVSHELAPLYLLCIFLLAFFAATVVVAMIASGNFLWLIVSGSAILSSLNRIRSCAGIGGVGTGGGVGCVLDHSSSRAARHSRRSWFSSQKTWFSTEKT